MTKKHFIAIAAVLKAHKARPGLVTALANEFAKLSPNFDLEKFVSAALGGTK